MRELSDKTAGALLFEPMQKMIKAHLKEVPYFERESIKGAILNGVINLVIVIISIILLVNYGENALLALLPSVLFCVLSPAILRYMPETKLLTS